VAATLKLVREGLGIELRRGTFHVLVDTNDVASIEWKEAIEVPIEPGHHTLQIKAAATPAEYAPLTRPLERSSTSAATAPGSGPSMSRPSSSPTWQSRSNASSWRPRALHDQRRERERERER